MKLKLSEAVVLVVLGAEKVTRNCGQSCCMADISSLCFSSLFLTVSMFHFCTSLSGVEQKQVLLVVPLKERKAAHSSPFLEMEILF